MSAVLTCPDCETEGRLVWRHSARISYEVELVGGADGWRLTDGKRADDNTHVREKWPELSLWCRACRGDVCERQVLDASGLTAGSDFGSSRAAHWDAWHRWWPDANGLFEELTTIAMWIGDLAEPEGYTPNRAALLRDRCNSPALVPTVEEWRHELAVLVERTVVNREQAMSCGRRAAEYDDRLGAWHRTHKDNAVAAPMLTPHEAQSARRGR